MEPEKIFAGRVNATTGQAELLIKRLGLPVHDCLWELKSSIKEKFPSFDLEDKVNFDGVGIDTYEAIRPPVLFQYKRKDKTGKQ